MSLPPPTIRLHMWLERTDSTVFGMGRALLLQCIDEHGSLKGAAEALGMSYRAAWGKLKQTEQALGTRLVEKGNNCREGYRLTPAGREAMTCYLTWFAEVERHALECGARLLPWEVQHYGKEKLK